MIKRNIAAAALSLGAFGAAGGALAEGHGSNGVDYRWNGGGWGVEQYYTESKGWCAAHADYQGGERLLLIAGKGKWTLRVSHARWGGVEKGGRYKLFLNTDRNWTAGTRAWGYQSASGRGGYSIDLSRRALDALARGGALYLLDQRGAQIAALDLTGSAKAISALRECRTHLRRSGGFAGRSTIVGSSPATVATIQTQPDAITPTGPSTIIAPPVAFVDEPAAQSDALVEEAPIDGDVGGAALVDNEASRGSAPDEAVAATIEEPSVAD